MQNLKIGTYTVNGEHGEAEELRLCMFNGRSDFTLLKMAADCGFPRGFPVVVNIKTGKLLMSGFYPKFANDDEQKDSFLEESKSAQRLTVVRKWSGYLTGCVLYKVNGVLGYIVTSKKSAEPESPFVQKGRELWVELMTPHALKILWDSKVRSVWAETMTHTDQKHGAKVTKESVVITGAGVEITKDTIRPTVLGDDDLFDLLQKAGLEQYCATPIHPNADIIEKFVLAIQKDRDHMTERKFQQLLKSFGLNTDSRHMSILGDRLEGLILKFKFTNGSFKILKYKFPGYTKVTMCVRSCSSSEDGLTPLGSGESWKPTFRFIRAIESFVNRWVFGEENRSYYRGLLMVYGKLYDSRLQAYDPNNPTAVGPWIEAADDLDQMLENGAEIKSFTGADLKEHIIPYTLILTLGPIGSGKTTASKVLARLLGLDEIDGDILGLNEETVLALGAERNFLTLSRIACSLAEGRTPIVSTNGGALLGAGMKFVGIETVENMIGSPVNVITVVPGPGKSWGQQISTEFLDQIYGNKQRVVDTVKGRLKRKAEAGEPPMKPGDETGLCNRLSTQSLKNYPIVQKIMEQTLATSNGCLTFPLVHDGKVAEPPSELLMTLPDFESPGPIRSLQCKQLRDLYMVQARDIVADMAPEVAAKYGKKNLSGLAKACGQNKVYHETKMFSKSLVDVPLQTESKDSEEKMQRWQLTILDLQKHSVALCVILMDDTSDRHLTVNNGHHKAVQMREVARAYNSDAKELTLSATITEGKKPNITTTTANVTYPLRESNDRYALVKTLATLRYLAPSFIYGN